MFTANKNTEKKKKIPQRIVNNLTKSLGLGRKRPVKVGVAVFITFRTAGKSDICHADSNCKISNSLEPCA